MAANNSMQERPGSNVLERRLSFSSAFFLVVASMIGTGIFATSGFIIEELANARAMLVCWFLGGLFALTGALCYGELGAMFPRAGGEYAFLRESFGKNVAFLSGWISLIVGFSGPIAAASIAFATYTFRALDIAPATTTGLSLFGVDIITVSPITITAVAVILALSLVHYHSLVLGSRVQNALTVLKIAVIFGFAVAGLWLGKGSTANLSTALDTGVIFSNKFAVSLVFVSFAYSGWNAATYLGGEVKSPGRNIPLSLLSGTLLVIGLYLLLNVTYIYALPVDEMSGVIEIGTGAAVSLFGKGAARFLSGAISVCLLSVIGSMILTGPRVYYAMAKDGVFFSRFGKVSSKRKTPGYSILLQAGLAILMVATTAFDALLLYVGFTLSLFAMLTAVGLIWLRIAQPDLVRPYRTFGYPVTPILFVLGNLWIISATVMSRPIVSAFGFATIGIGALFCWYFRTRGTPP
jgi:APA family basic amino acid/polyamine antiporter